MSLRATVKNGAVIAGLALCPVAAMLAGWPAWAVAIVAVWSLVLLHRMVQRRGGWRLFGPHLYFDLIRMSRKGRTALFRFLFLVVLVGAIFATHQKYEAAFADADLRHQIQEEDPFKPRPGGRQLGLTARPSLTNVTARFNSECIYRWFLLQNIAILVLTPAYVGGAIAEERERGTLDLLFTSALLDREILLGKLVARITHLGGLLLAGLPIFSMMLVFGGVDMQLLLENWINSVLLLLTTSSICLMISTVPIGSTACVIVCYAVVSSPGFCCSWSASGFPLVVDIGDGIRMSGNELVPKVVMLGGYGLFTAFGLTMAFLGLRPKEPSLIASPSVWSKDDAASAECNETDSNPKPMAIVTEHLWPGPGELWRPRLPPVTDDGLLWKECYTGGGSLLQVREVFVGGSTVVGVVSLILLAALLDGGHETPPASVLVPLARIAYLALLAFFAIGVAMRAAGCVVREKESRTLDLLLQVPTDRSEILWAKWTGVLWKGRVWVYLLASDLLLALLVGAFSPVAIILLVGSSILLVLFLCSFGLFVSVMVRTRLQANLILAIVALALGTFVMYVARGFPMIPTSRWVTMIALASMVLLAVGSVISWLAARILFERTGRGHWPDRFSGHSKRDDLR